MEYIQNLLNGQIEVVVSNWLEIVSNRILNKLEIRVINFFVELECLQNWSRLVGTLGAKLEFLENLIRIASIWNKIRVQLEFDLNPLLNFFVLIYYI